MPEQVIAWDNADVSTLKTMWAAGHSLGQIAAQIPSATRSAIAGKIARLKLPSPDRKKSPFARSFPDRPQPAPKPASRPGRVASVSKTLGQQFSEPPQRRNQRNSIAEKIAIAEAEPGLSERLKGETPDGTGIKFMDLRPNTCRWPKGDPLDANFEFCGSKSLPDLPYCTHHSRMAYAPLKVRERQDKWSLHGAEIQS